MKYSEVKFIAMLLVFQFGCISGTAQDNKTEVMIISTIHGAHKVNQNYTYDSLFSFIGRNDPDIIGVEIRSEDIDSSISYLAGNYPFEMYECINRYPDKLVLGFDWLGDDIAGRAIPKNYWKEQNIIKELQVKLSADSILTQKLSILNVIREEKNRLALNASLRELNDGRYDLINRIYYEQLKLLLKDTEYELLSNFYQKRDEMIARNILEIIRNNTGKRMIFLLGADHRDYAVRAVSEVADLIDGSN